MIVRSYAITAEVMTQHPASRRVCPPTSTPTRWICAAILTAAQRLGTAPILPALVMPQSGRRRAAGNGARRGRDDFAGGEVEPIARRDQMRAQKRAHRLLLSFVAFDFRHRPGRRRHRPQLCGSGEQPLTQCCGDSFFEIVTFHCRTLRSDPPCDEFNQAFPHSNPSLAKCRRRPRQIG
jgi:hypothetical protein